MARKKTPHCWNCKTKLDIPIDAHNITCSHCHTRYCEKPRVESLLHQYQEKYLETREKKYFSLMLELLNTVFYNLIVSKLKKSAKFLNDEDIQDKVQWCLLKMVNLYEKPEFKIGYSFISYCRQVVLYPLYNYQIKKIDNGEISLNTPLKVDGKDGKEYTLLDKISEEMYLDTYFGAEEYFYKDLEKDCTIQQSKDFFSTLVTISYTKKDFNYALKMLLLFYHRLNKKSDRFFNEWWKKEGLELRDAYEKSLVVFKGSIKDAGSR